MEANEPIVLAIDMPELIFLAKEILTSNFESFPVRDGKIIIWDGSDYVDMAISDTIRLIGENGISVVGDLTASEITFSNDGTKVGTKTLDETGIPTTPGAPNEYFLHYDKTTSKVQYMSIDDLAEKIADAVATIVLQEKVEEKEMLFIDIPVSGTYNYNLDKKIKDGTVEMVFVNGQLMDNGDTADYTVDEVTVLGEIKSRIKFSTNYATPTEPAKVKVFYKY